MPRRERLRYDVSERDAVCLCVSEKIRRFYSVVSFDFFLIFATSMPFLPRSTMEGVRGGGI
jgi:hypothetical protein